MDQFCQNGYMRSVDNNKFFQKLFEPKKILNVVDRQLEYGQQYCQHRCSA